MKKFNIKLTQSISALLILILSPDLRAQSVAMIPSDIWTSKLNSVLTSVSNPFSKTTAFNFLNGQVVSNQVDFSGQFTILNLKPDVQSGLFGLQVTLDSVQAVAKDLQIHVQVEQDLGFGSATINLNAVCSSAIVNTKSAQSVFVQVDRNFQVQSVQTNFDKLNLETKLEGCDAIHGLKEEVQARLLAVLKTQLFESHLKQIISSEISNQINLKIKNVVSYFVENKAKDVNVKLSIDTLNKMWIFVGDKADTTFTVEEIAQLSRSDKSAALIKKDQLEQSLMRNLNAQMVASPIISQGNSKLEQLTCSRFVQFFVWPALKAFPKCFVMQFVSEIKELKLTDLAQLKFFVKANSWAQAKEPLRNIAFFTIASDVSLNPSKVKINSIVGQHDPEFLKWSGKSSRISTSLVTSTLQSYLQQQIAAAIQSNEMLNPKNIQNMKLISPETLFVQLK